MGNCVSILTASVTSCSDVCQATACTATTAAHTVTVYRVQVSVHERRGTATISSTTTTAVSPALRFETTPPQANYAIYSLDFYFIYLFIVTNWLRSVYSAKFKLNNKLLSHC